MGMDLPIAAIRQQIASAVDIIIHLGRLKDKSRKVLQIVEVCDYRDGIIRLNVIEEYDYTVEKLIRKGALENETKLQAAGIKSCNKKCTRLFFAGVKNMFAAG